MRNPLHAVAVKEIRQLRRDRGTLIFILVIPAFLLLMYGFALTFDIRKIPLAVCDQDQTKASRSFAELFTNTEYFVLKYRLADSREVDRLMGEEKIRVALVIPPGFSRKILANEKAAIQVIIDGSNSQSAATTVGYVSSIVQGESIDLMFASLDDQGIRRLEMPLKMETRVWYNPELRSAKFLIPGLIAFILMVVVVVSTAFSVVREKERGTMEQILVAPIRPLELIAGKTIPYFLISLVSVHFVLFLSYLLFGISIRGSYGWLLLSMVLFLLGGLGQGLLISTITGTQQAAFMLAITTTFLPTFLLSGFVFPVRNMPVAVQALTFLVPAKYFLVALRSIILKGSGLKAFWPQFLFLLGFAALALGVSTIRMTYPGNKKGRGRAS